MISISNTTWNTAYSNVILQENADVSKITEKQARVSRTATLDGGVYINHSGYTDGDRTLYITAKANQEQVTTLNNMLQNEIFLIVSFVEGVFLCVLESMKVKNNNVILSILIKQKENE